MNMKKILQAMDGISARPVAGADSMARFLRVVKEAELNQPAAIQQPAAQTNVSPAVKPYVHAPGPDDPNFDRYVDLMWKYEFLDNERTGKANLIKVDVGVSDEANAEIDRMKYEAEKLAGPNLPAWEKARIGYRTDPEYIKYSQDMAAKMSAELLEDANVASTLSPEQLSYNHLRTQLDYIDAVRDTGGRKNVFVDISPEVAAGEARFRDKLAQLAASLKAKGIDAAAEYDAPEPGEPEAAPVDLNQKYATEQVGIRKFLSIVRKNDVSMLSEGTNPHRVALPVQMAMQHYQQVKEIPQPRERLIDKYFVEAETEIMQRREEKRALINQYAKTIAERVLMKESVQDVLEGDVPADPNKLTASMLMGGEYKELDLTPLIVKNNWVGTPKQVINQADKWLSDFLRQRGNMYSNLKIKYKGLTMTSSKIGDVDAPDLEFESMVEAPIEMTGDANDPHIYGHEKANPMSLKGRISQARAQLKELAELAESDSLLAWEQICKKAKGGMFMGLEQNLEQIRHGISELAKQRRKGGVASRGIDKHIGEGKRK